jgi:hypothetical protein
MMDRRKFLIGAAGTAFADSVQSRLHGQRRGVVLMAKKAKLSLILVYGLSGCQSPYQFLMSFPTNINFPACGGGSVQGWSIMVSGAAWRRCRGRRCLELDPYHQVTHYNMGPPPRSVDPAIGPIRPTRGHIAISPPAAYTRCHRCAGAPNHPCQTCLQPVKVDAPYAAHPPAPPRRSTSQSPGAGFAGRAGALRRAAGPLVRLWSRTDWLAAKAKNAPRTSVRAPGWLDLPHEVVSGVS